MLEGRLWEYFRGELVDVPASEEGEMYVFEGILLPPEGENAEKLFRAMFDLGYYTIIRRQNGAYQVVLLKAPPQRGQRIWIHLFLFLATVLTTLFAGAIHAGVNPLASWANLLKGIPFSASLLLILGSHEMGHFVASRIHRVDASLPYFIPVPHPLIGTMGAFIRIRSPLPSRRALLDIGAAGPLVGALVAIPVTIWGLALSKVAPVSGEGAGLILGDSLIFKALAALFGPHVPPGHALYLSPVAFAGWLGFFVTALNLLPMGQLDGGHIAYALFGRYHRIIGRITLLALLPMGFFWQGWWLWAILGLVLGLWHPAPLNEITPLDTKRKVVGALSALLFLLTFIPAPFQVHL